MRRPLVIDPSSYRYGILVAAELASQYDNASTHPYRLEDCILGKLNLLNRKPRKNKTGAKIETVLLRLERKITGLEGTVQFMSRRFGRRLMKG